MRTIAEYRSALSDWKDELQRSIGVRDELLKQKKSWGKKEDANKELAEKAVQSLNFVEESVRSVRNKTLRSIEAVANEALQAVYDENLKLECDFGIKRDRSAVTLRYVKKIGDGQLVKRDPDGSGCGVSDVVAFALRLVLIKATGSESVLVADEPFKWLGRDQIPKAAALLKFLSHKLGIQIIVTSHHQVLRDTADLAHGLEIDEDGIVRVISEGA
jgi:DNA repair exonuclease SbcCD ATPase subunit